MDNSDYERSGLDLICFHCKYNTKHLHHMKKHILSKKHIKNKECENIIVDNKTALGCVCEFCSKSFSSKRSRVSHQLRSCKMKKAEDQHKQAKIKLLNTQTKALQKKQEETEKEIEEGNISSIPQAPTAQTAQTINNNTVNNNVVVNQHFNLQIYLNEDCKDAIDIGEFTKSIKITMDDLMYIGNNGWSDGMTKLIVDNLKKLDANQRPIQCSDAKRDVTYIKDGDWKKDKEHDLMEKTIKELNKEHYKAVGTWTKEKYPVAGTNAADDLHRVLCNLSPGQEPEKKMNKVKRNIRNATAIDKTMDNTMDNTV
tara:strand:- start:181 stop:1116 length:936 start_codon:yes stop_codon:yes gene_type:complete